MLPHSYQGASIWPRRQRRGEQVGRDRARRRGEASIWPRRQRRGEQDGRQDDAGLVVASIWPRRQRRGEPTTAARSWPGRSCFNLATTSASWRTRRANTESETSRGFNLATTSASWRTRLHSPGCPGRRGLQFGHDVSVVENSGKYFGRGDYLAASIWPRRQRRGERSRPRSCPPTWSKLQFGHDVSVVENDVWDFARLPGNAASIWPRRQRRGEQGVFADARGRSRASIWPRRQRRGEHVGDVGRPRRVLASIWPRRQRRGEPSEARVMSANGIRFNLATTSASWRTTGVRIWQSHTGSLQFGHDVSVVENSTNK